MKRASTVLAPRELKFRKSVNPAASPASEDQDRTPSSAESGNSQSQLKTWPSDTIHISNSAKSLEPKLEGMLLRNYHLSLID